MRKAELLEQISEYQSDDIIGIAVYIGNDEYESQAISRIIKGKGIALLATPSRDKYKMVIQ